MSLARAEGAEAEDRSQGEDGVNGIGSKGRVVMCGWSHTSVSFLRPGVGAGPRLLPGSPCGRDGALAEHGDWLATVL